MILCWFISNCFEALIGASLTRYFIRGPLRFVSSAERRHFLPVCRGLRSLYFFLPGCGIRALESLGSRQLLAALANSLQFERLWPSSLSHLSS